MISSSVIPSSSYPLSGEVDIAVSSSLEHELSAVAAASDDPELEVDCSSLTFIDASGVTMLLNVAARSHKRVKLLNLTPQCSRVFEILDLCDHFGLAKPALRLVPSPTSV